MTIAPELHTPTLGYLPAPTVRRRKVILGLTGVDAAAAVAAVGTSSPVAWAGLVVAVALTATYVVLLRRSRRLEMERDFRLLTGTSHSRDILGDLADLAVGPEGTFETAPVVALDSVPAWRQGLALARFVASYAAGWALAPLVFALTIAVGRTPRDTTGQRWLANLQSAQVRLREQSMRTLVVSATATASVTGVGAATVLAGTGVATAAPAPAASAGVGLAASAGMPGSAGLAMSAGMPGSAGMAGSAGVGLPAAASSTYRVASGDTLSSIAARFGTTYQALAAANHIANPNLIYPGQVLVLSGASSAGAAPASYRTSGSGGGGSYTVRAGDTLSAIAARFGTTYQALAAINGIANPNVIEVGQVLRLSGSAATAAPVATAIAASPAPLTTSAPAASSRASVAVRTALAQVGKPYQWAGAGPYSFDCSGLVVYAWAAAGVPLPHYSVAQYEDTTRIAQSQLQPGDLVFYNTGGGAQPGHVVIYIGNGQIVTADSPGTAVRVENLYWDGAPIGFGRV